MIVKLNEAERRILEVLLDWYPITVEELRDELRMREDVLMRNLRAMMMKGVVELEPLTNKTYIRLLMTDVQIAHKGRRPKTGHEPDDEYDALMYQ